MRDTKRSFPVSGAIKRRTKLLLACLFSVALPASAQVAVTTFAGNAQHTAVYPATAQNLNGIHWSTSVDLNNNGTLAHYGAPLVSAANIVFVPVKTAAGGFEVSVFSGSTGHPLYTLGTDYAMPAHNWIPAYSPALTTTASGTRLYYAGAGGTVYYVDNPDSAPQAAPVQRAFYGMAAYQANTAAFNASVFIDTPLTSDSQGNIFFGFRVQGSAPAPLNTGESGFARIDQNGNASYVLAGTAAADSNIGRDSHNSAPALSNDQSTLYVLVKGTSTDSYGYLLGLDSLTLATKYKTALKDPRNGNYATISDDSTASPMIAPDNDVYIGVLGNPKDNHRGFLLRFSVDLTVEKTPGAFGWDYTPAVVPATMVPSYTGSSSYLIFSKYNDYTGDDGGQGVNRIALLDPNATQLDGHPSARGLTEMREVLTASGLTPDAYYVAAGFPLAVSEWCVNTPAINPATNSVIVPSEDGRIYRWDLSANSLSQTVPLAPGSGEAYVPVVIGPDGTTYTINGGNLFALGNVSGTDIALTSTASDLRTAVAGQSITFTASVGNTATPGVTPTGTVTFQDLSFQGAASIAVTLDTVPLDAAGNASIATASLQPGAHFITAIYSGSANLAGASSTRVELVHAGAALVALTSSLNPSEAGQPVTLTATAAAPAAGSGFPTGMVTFTDSGVVIGQVPLLAGIAALPTTELSAGRHALVATYASDGVFAAASGTLTQRVGASNAAPVAINVMFTGRPNVNQILTGHYTYSDAEGDPQGVSLFRWLRDGAPIAGATSLTYMPVIADASHSLSFEVTPVATTGAAEGVPARSSGMAISLSAVPLVRSAGLLSGSADYSPNPANLTAEGNADWIHLGDPQLNRKATGNSQLGTVSVIGNTTVFGYMNDPRPLSWTDGTPNTAFSNDLNGIYVSNPGNGFSFTAPADTNVRTLVVHAGGYFSVARLTAHLSDSSSPDFVDVTTPLTILYDRNYVLTYSAASAGQTLTVSWTEVTDLGAGNVNLNAAALSNFSGAITAVSGNPQSTVVGSVFPTTLQVSVTDANSHPVSGAVVTFTAPGTGVTGSFSGQATVTAVTGASGIASAPAFTANGSAGSYYVTASVSGMPSTAGFALTNTAGPPVSITPIAGTPGSAVVNTAFTSALQALVKDGNNNPVAGATVTFTGPSSTAAGVTFAGAGTTGTATTNASGIAFAPAMKANGQPGTYLVGATVGSGLTPAYYTLTNTNGGTGFLAGAGNNSSGAVNLTATGTSDWIHWGDANVNRKASGGSQISNFNYASTLIAQNRSGSQAAPELLRTGKLHPENMGFEGYGNDIRLMNWTDGSPVGTSSNNGNGLFIDFGTYVTSGQTGFTFTAPADGTARTLTIYAGGTNSGGTLIAHLSDASAPDFVDTTAVNGSFYDRNYTLTYSAGSPGQTLTVSWVMSSGNGNVSLSGAALSVGMASTIAATGGTPQSTMVNTAFGLALQATVLDSNRNPRSGVTVTFVGPASGAGALFGGSTSTTAVTNNNGVATAAASANSTGGTYVVTATLAGVTTPASFSLTNLIGGGSLSGSGNSSANTASLTAEGASDWVHWGDAVLNRKTGVTPLISNYTVVGGGQVLSYPNDPRTLSWTDGTPTASGSNQSGLYILGLNNGFSFTVPADGTRRTLTLHAGGWLTGGTLTAHLSDQSAADYVDTTPLANTQFDQNYSLIYNAGSPGQTLTVTWVATSGNGNMTLNGAALSLTPPSVSTAAGTPQSAMINTAFSTALQAIALDANNHPLSGITVTFTAPTGAGAGASFGGSPTATANTNSSGIATAPPLTANGQPGKYTVSATLAGVAAPAVFNLSNFVGGGTLAGSGNDASTTANLTAEGTSDWVHWGEAPLNRKNGVSAQISDYTVIGSQPVTTYNNDARGLSWTDGTPTASATANGDGLYVFYTQDGFSFTAPADSNTRTLTVHVGGWLSGATLTAHLSDSSAADFVDTTSLATTTFDRNYTLTYSAGAPGQTLTVTWVMSAGGGNITLNGAALSTLNALTPQTISFGPLGSVNFGAPPFTVNATASSGLPVSFTSTTTGICTVAGNTVTMIAPGICSVTASQPGNTSFGAAAPVTQSFSVVASSQTITFGALSGVPFGMPPFTLTATATSGLAVTFTSTTSGVCTVAGNTVTIVGAGSCSITADQAGNASFPAATPVTQTFTVSQASQTITFPAVGNAAVGSAPALSATASSGLPVSFAATTPAVCSIGGAALTLIAPGTCTITASQAGNANYGAAPPVTQSFTVAASSQTIAFGPLPGLAFGASPFTVTATASSGLAVTFSSNTAGTCTVAGAVVTIVGAGTCSVTATQPGNANFGAAAVTQTFAVAQASQSITFAPLSSGAVGSTATLTATATSGLPVSFASTTPAACSVSGASVTLVAAGTCSVSATQAGNANYTAAAPVTQSFSISPTSGGGSGGGGSSGGGGTGGGGGGGGGGLGGGSPLTASPAALTINVAVGGAPGTQTITMSYQTYTQGAPTLTCNTTTNQGFGWLSVSPSSQTMTQASYAGTLYTYQASVTASADPTGLAAGVTDTGNLNCSVAGGPASVAVTMNVAAQPAVYTPAPASLAFTYRIGDPNTPPTQSISVFSKPSGAGFSASVSSNASWLTLGTATGTTPQSLPVSVSVSGLAAGTFSGSIGIASGTAATLSVPVTLTILKANPQLSVSPSLESVATLQGGAAVHGQVTVSNAGGGALQFTAASQTAWLTLSSASGSATPTSAGALGYTADPAGLGAGVYTGQITVTDSSSGNQTVVNVVMAVAASPSLSVSRSGVLLTAVSGGPQAPSQSFTVLHPGNATPTWSLQTQVLPNPLSGASWLAAAAAGSTVTVTANTSGLSAGQYFGSVNVLDANAPNSPQTVSVALNVLPSSTTPALTVSPGGVLLTGAAGSKTVAQQTVTVFNPSASATAYVASAITSGGGAWLAVSPATGTLTPGSNSLMVTADLSGFSSLLPTGGVQNGTVRLAFDNGTVSTLQVIVVAENAASTGAKFLTARPARLPASLARGACLAGQPGYLIPVFRLPGNPWQAQVASPVTVQAQVVDDCGNAASSAQGGSVQVTFGNGDPGLDLRDIGNGLWEGTWVPVTSGPAVTLQLSASQGTLRMDPAQLAGTTLTAAVQPASADSPGQPTGVVNAASGAQAVPQLVALNSYVAIYGQGLSSGAATSATSLPLPTTLNGTQLLLGGKPMPLLFAGSGQVNALVPQGLSPNASYPLVVIRGATQSVPVSLTVASLQPGIYSVDTSGSGAGIVTNSVTGQLINAANPAHAGDYLTVYCTGLGMLRGPNGEPQPADGAAAPPDVVFSTAAQVTAAIGGVTTPAAFAGLTPTFAGLYQVNLRVPDGVLPGNAVPVTISAADPQTGAAVQSNSIVIAVQ